MNTDRKVLAALLALVLAVFPFMAQAGDISVEIYSDTNQLAADEALNMKLRASLIREIRSKVTEANWTQKETANQLGITQPRVSDLLNGKLSKFSLDALVNMFARLGGNVKLRVA